MKRNLKLGLIIAAGVVSFFLLCVFLVQGAQNKAIIFEEQINTAKSDIDVQEKRRVDLLYNLVDTVKAYDEHEYQTLKDTVDARANGGGDISDVTTLISATAEAYPTLASSDNYKQLMNELSITENMIAEYRSNYNKQVKSYNRYVRQFPASMFLSIAGYEKVDVDYLNYDAPEDAPTNLFDKE